MRTLDNKNHPTAVERRPALLLSVAPLLLGMAFFWPFGGSSGKTVQLTGSQQTPAAHGTVTVENGPNDNTKLDIKVQSLAQPTALTPPEQVYVVWVQSDGRNTAINEGQLKIDKNLSAQLNTKTPYKNFQVFITGQANPQAKNPQGPHLLSASITNG